MRKTNSYVPLILGIIGGIFAILGGTCATICADAASSIGGESKYLIWGYLALAMGVLGLIGGCVARKTGIGSLLMLLAAIVDIVCLIFLGSIIWTIVIGIALFAVGGTVGLVTQE